MFDTRLSIEMDPVARKTLMLRSFYRQMDGPAAKRRYREYLRGDRDLGKLLASDQAAAAIADREAWQAELGAEDRSIVRDRIDEALNGAPEWVLLGGPPCQAYSLVGRSRMLPVLGEKEFSADPRHQLYKEYLRILADHAPTAFIFENVRGILSSKLNGSSVFDRIYADLKNPSNPFDDKEELRHKPRYRLFPLTIDTQDDDADPKPEDFIIRSEEYGIPQRRHRLIILGVNVKFLKNNPGKFPGTITKQSGTVSIEQVIADLPTIRSAPSRPSGSFQDWCATLAELADMPINLIQPSLFDDTQDSTSVKDIIRSSVISASESDRGSGGSYIDYSGKPEYNPAGWYRDGRQKGITNHESRTHMRSDLQRYLFSSSFAVAVGRTPTLRDFPEELMPEHKNAAASARNGHFADRFRVQVRDRPATTITSHISKDGHYFIHYDPAQCRSLTVREAARIQTFSDDYHFEGPRTEQYRQVGNAVPPYLAYQIAGVVGDLLNPADL